MDCENDDSEWSRNESEYSGQLTSLLKTLTLHGVKMTTPNGAETNSVPKHLRTIDFSFENTDTVHGVKFNDSIRMEQKQCSEASPDSSLVPRLLGGGLVSTVLHASN